MKVTESIDVQYKLVSKHDRLQSDDIFHGKLLDIDRERTVVAGGLPDESWIEPLQAGKVLIGLNIFLPTASIPIKVLTNVERVLPAGSAALPYHLVLGFRDITPDHHRRIIRYLVSLYLKRGGHPGL